jgi:hypothetical protein
MMFCASDVSVSDRKLSRSVSSNSPSFKPRNHFFGSPIAILPSLTTVTVASPSLKRVQGWRSEWDLICNVSCPANDIFVPFVPADA